MAESVFMSRSIFALIVVLILPACSSDGSRSQEQRKPPVVVVKAPPEGSDSGSQTTDATYPGLAWQTPKSEKPVEGASPSGEAAAQGTETEPYDVVAMLREFDPELTDAPKDQTSDTAFDDLLSAHAVTDDNFLYGRIVTRAPMQGDNVREIRFWIEQDDGKKMATVEIKIGSQESPCELSDTKSPETQNVVTGCFWLGNAIDFRIPLDKVPSVIDTKAPFHVSGFQTCCEDEARNNPFDELEGAQGVWRVPGVASEVETK